VTGEFTIHVAQEVWGIDYMRVSVIFAVLGGSGFFLIDWFRSYGSKYVVGSKVEIRVARMIESHLHEAVRCPMEQNLAFEQESWMIQATLAVLHRETRRRIEGMIEDRTTQEL
jgi:hypothetical protein